MNSWSLNPGKDVFPEFSFYEDIPPAVYPPVKSFLFRSQGMG